LKKNKAKTGKLDIYVFHM